MGENERIEIEGLVAEVEDLEHEIKVLKAKKNKAAARLRRYAAANPELAKGLGVKA